jgi:hypothetical protein
MALLSAGGDSFSMKHYVVNENQLMELTLFERIGERAKVVTEIKKHEITRAPLPIKEPLIFNPVN